MRRFLQPVVSKSKPIFIKNTQSNNYEVVKVAMPIIKIFKKQKPTQASEFVTKQSTRVMMVDGQAYWISNSKLYSAEILNGRIDNNSTKEVDTISMDDVQLKKTIFIVSKLTEGLEDDRGNSRNTKF